MTISAKGIVLLVRIHDLEILNQQRGFQAGDELLKRVAVLLKESSGSMRMSALARLTGGDFGIFIPNASPWDGEQIATDMAHKLSRLAAEQIAATDNIGHLGVAAYDGVTTLGRLLSEADLALGSAMRKGDKYLGHAHNYGRNRQDAIGAAAMEGYTRKGPPGTQDQS